MAPPKVSYSLKLVHKFTRFPSPAKGGDEGEDSFWIFDDDGMLKPALWLCNDNSSLALDDDGVLIAAAPGLFEDPRKYFSKITSDIMEKY